MKALSLFSGLGGFDEALRRAGVDVTTECEWDRDCQSVLRRHFPEARLVDDVRKLLAMIEPRNAHRFADELVRRRYDIVCGGFPCQDLSVAGRRAGLAGERSGMWFVFRRLIGILRPRWVCIENVVGLLSSDAGRDLGCILTALGRMGYRYAYRVVDSQWFGVAQRRRRVFIVGCLGERLGKPFPDERRILGLLGSILFESDCLPWDSAPSREARAHVAALTSNGVGTCGADDNQAQAGHLLAFGGNNTRGPIDVATACTAHGGTGRHDFESETFVTHAPTFNASDYANGDFEQSNISRPITCSPDRSRATPIALAYQCHGSNVGPMGTLRQGNGNETGGVPFMPTQYGVRRLTPRECERLQGFPDDWTRYGHDGREISDSARYRMLGNAVTLNVVEWIVKRLVAANKNVAEYR